MGEAEENVFAQRLRHAREVLRQWTQAELADRSKLPTSAISHFEREVGGRKPSFENLRRLANALSVSIDYLMGRTDDPIAQVVDDALYRDIKLLNDDDRRTTEIVVQQLAERRKREQEK